jgi:SAM-dependent methyltransferase
MNTPTLDIGCGANKFPGAIGLDMDRTFLVPGDVRFELHSRKYVEIIPPKGDIVKREIHSRSSLPFQDNVFSRIYMNDIIEHLDDIAWVLSEVHRVAKPDANVFIRYPHFTSVATYSDVTHVHKLGVRAFDHFDPSTEYGERYKYYNMFGRSFPFKIESTHVHFPHIYRGLSVLLCETIGLTNYERIFARFMPMGNVSLEMRVIK